MGQAAHCSGTGPATGTDGCDSGSLPIGTPVEVNRRHKPRTLAYNSWPTMQARTASSADTCAYNDMALIRLDPADVTGRTHRYPVGRTGRAPPRAERIGVTVYSYGNSELRGGVTKLSPKRGMVVRAGRAGT